MKVKLMLFPFLLMTVFSNCQKKICSIDHQEFIVNGAIGIELDEMILAASDIKFSGAVMVIQKEEILLKKTYSFQKRNSPCDITPDPAYWIASLSKQFCAATIMLLRQQGKLNLQDPLSKFFKELPQDKKELTIHQLLTHTSGLGDTYPADGIANRDKAALALLKNDLIHPPGVKYSYSNDGYQLLAIIVEILSQQSYQSFLQEHLFNPLDMFNSGSSGDQKIGNELEVAPKGKGARKEVSGNPQNWEENYGYKGSTGILINTNDLYLWHQSLQNNEFLSPNSTELLFTEHVFKATDIHYGYAWNIINSEQGKVIVHSGEDDFIGHHSTFRYYPEQDLLVIILSNAGKNKEMNATRALTSKIVNRLF